MKKPGKKQTTTKAEPEATKFIPYIVEELKGGEVKAMTRSTLPGVGDLRRNRASTIVRTDRFKNIIDTFDPFYRSGAYVTIQDVIYITQQAYRAFPPLRNIIEIKNSICTADILLKDGNDSSNAFVQSWMDKININAVQDQFYRELYRSGNVFFYRFFADLNADEVSKLTGQKKVTNTIPLKYVVLNPGTVTVKWALNYLNPIYFRVLTRAEVMSLKNPQTDEDKRVFDALSDADKQAVQSGVPISIPIDMKNLRVIFYQKQDYEPFAVPSYFGVLEKINWKMELQNIDAAISRCTDWAILLITMGQKASDGGYDPNATKIMHEMLQNQSVKKSIVSDYTTKGEWLVPEVAQLLGPEKYKQVNADIQEGLSPLLFGEDKFATAKTKLAIFIKTLEQDRRRFLQFINNEIKQMCKDLGFKAIPTAYYPNVNLEDESLVRSTLLKFVQTGIMTPNEFYEALETGVFPDEATMLADQKEFKTQKDAGLFMPAVPPVAGGAAGAGRPAGTTGIPQSTKNVSPVGTKASVNEEQEERPFTIPMEDLASNVILTTALQENIRKELRKKKVAEADIEIALAPIVTKIQLSYAPDEWSKNISKKMAKASEVTPETLKKIKEISDKHELPLEYATIIYISKK